MEGTQWREQIADVPGVLEVDAYRDKDEANKAKIEGVEAVNIVPRERLQQHTGEQTVDVPVPQIMEETGRVTRSVPQVRPRLMDEIIGVLNLTPQGQAQNRTLGQTVATLASEIQEKIAEVIQLVLQQRTPERNVQRCVEVPGVTQAEAPAVQVAQKSVEIPQAKIEAKNGLENYRITMRNTVTGENFKFKLKARNREKTEKSCPGRFGLVEQEQVGRE